MDFCSVKDTICIKLIDPVKDKKIKEYVFFGDIPDDIRKIIDSRNLSSPKLKTYFGSDWRQKLHIKGIKGGDDNTYFPDQDDNNFSDQENNDFDIDFEQENLGEIGELTKILKSDACSLWKEFGNEKNVRNVVSILHQLKGLSGISLNECH